MITRVFPRRAFSTPLGLSHVAHGVSHRPATNFPSRRKSQLAHAGCCGCCAEAEAAPGAAAARTLSSSSCGPLWRRAGSAKTPVRKKAQEPLWRPSTGRAACT